MKTLTLLALALLLVTLRDCASTPKQDRPPKFQYEDDK